jgi:hypothetical protein
MDCQELQLGKRDGGMDGWRGRNHANNQLYKGTICNLLPCIYLLFLTYNIEKCTQKATFNQYILVIELNIYFIKIHVIKTIVSTQPLVIEYFFSQMLSKTKMITHERDV